MKIYFKSFILIKKDQTTVLWLWSSCVWARCRFWASVCFSVETLLSVAACSRVHVLVAMKKTQLLHCFGIELFVADLLHPSVCEQNAVDRLVKRCFGRDGNWSFITARRCLLPRGKILLAVSHECRLMMQIIHKLSKGLMFSGLRLTPAVFSVLGIPCGTGEVFASVIQDASH